jgi:two-component system heavy metal sensor histidine kinase CusS
VTTGEATRGDANAGGSALIRRKSITFRLTLLYAVLSTTVLAVLGVLVSALVERHFVELDMELIDGKIELLERAVERVRSARELQQLPVQLDEALVGHSGLMVKVLGPDGATVFATPGAEFPDALLKSASAKGAPPIVWETTAQIRHRGTAVVARTGIDNAAPVVLAVATDISHHEHFMASFRNTLWAIIVAAVLLTSFLGWLVARRGLAPLQALRQRAAVITSQRLDYRLSLQAVPGELVELTNTLNDMLARLEESFRRLSDFSSDLAHELRSPVSNLLTQTQVTLSKARSSEEYRDVLASNAEEFERLSRMISDMLFLAKADNHLIVPDRQPVDLAAEAQGVLDFYESLAAENRITLSVSGSGQVSGDRLMLRRAISNLLSNAIRYTPRGGRIAVTVDGSDAVFVKLSVSNSGEPIPPGHLPRLFDRFYRVDASRERFSEGAGLGLAITRSILRAHGGEVQAHSEAGRTVFELTLPVDAAPGPSVESRQS